jgi:hypothetical protein
MTNEPTNEDPRNIRVAPVGRPNTLPGVWGPLARAMGGVMGLSTHLEIPERTIRHWAWNERSMDALAASLVADLCAARGILPVLYQSPNWAGRHIAHTPADGWVVFPSRPGGWALRSRFVARPNTITPATKQSVAAAVASGFPWPS